MTFYEYFKLKYKTDIVDKIFDANIELDKSKEIGIIGTRGFGQTIMQAIEIVLSDIVFGLKYRAMTHCQFQGELYSGKDFNQELIIHVEDDNERELIYLHVDNILKSINFNGDK